MYIANLRIYLTNAPKCACMLKLLTKIGCSFLSRYVFEIVVSINFPLCIMLGKFLHELLLFCNI